MSPTTDLAVTSPRGVGRVIKVREDTNDAATLHSTFWAPGWPPVLHDEYGLKDLHLSGWALDVGAHIGSVALALLLDNPNLQVIAIEAVPENANLLIRNGILAGVADRLRVISGAAEAEGVSTATVHYGSDDHSAFIGNLAGHGVITRTVPAYSLGTVLDSFGIGRLAFMKIDCEGCEFPFLSSPAVARVDLIVGEYHTLGADAIRALLSPTHDVEVTHEDGGFGLFRAVSHAGGRP